MDDFPSEVQHVRKQDFFTMYNEFVDVHCRHLEYLEISVYVVLCRFAGIDSASWPSYRTIAERIGADRQRVIETINKLAEKKYIIIEERKRENGSRASNLYKITDLRVLNPGGGYRDGGVVASGNQGGCIRQPGVVASGIPPEEYHKNNTKEQTLSAVADGARNSLKPENRINGTVAGKFINGHHPPEPLRPQPGFPLDNNPPVRQPSIATRCVNKLNDALTRKNVIRGRRPNLLKWEAEFNKFFNEMSDSPREFEENIDWYIDHMDDRYALDIRSATAFCEKYDGVRKARKRWIESQDGYTPDEPEEKMPEIQTTGTMTREEYDNYIKEYL